MADFSGWDGHGDKGKPTKGFGSGLENMEDGDYCFQIERASAREVKSGSEKKMILGLKLKPLSKLEKEGEEWVSASDEGAVFPEIKHDIWVGSQEEFDRLLGTLQTLGFDSANWKSANGRPFSQEFPKCCRHLRGMWFVGHKKTNESGGKTYHNLYINERLISDGKPEQYGAEELNIVVDEIEDGDPFAFGANAK